MFMILSLLCVLTILTQVKAPENTIQVEEGNITPFAISNVTFNFSRHIYVRKTIDNKIIKFKSNVHLIQMMTKFLCVLF